MLMKRVTAMKETSYNVEAKGSETIHIENEVCSRISLRLYIKEGSIAALIIAVFPNFQRP